MESEPSSDNQPPFQPIFHFDSRKPSLASKTPPTIQPTAPRKTRKFLKIFLLFSVIFVIFVGGGYAFFYGLSHRSSKKTQQTSVPAGPNSVVFVCEKNYKKDQLLELGDAVSGDEKINLHFLNQKLENLKQVIEINYKNEANAKIGLSKIMNQRVNQYISLGLKSDPFTLSHQIDEHEVKITRQIFSGALDRQNIKLTPIPLLTDSPDLRQEVVLKAYQNLDFACEQDD